MQLIKIIQLTISTSTTHQCTLLILIKDNQCVPLFFTTATVDIVTILTLSVTSCCTKLTGSTQDQSHFNQQKVSFEGGNLSLVTGDLAQGNSLLKDELRIKENSHFRPTFIPEPNHQDIRNKVSVTHHDMSSICSIMKFS